MCFTNSIYVFLCFFWVIIPDWQLPKFTENTHKIAENCVYNVQKLCASGGIRGWGWRENGGNSAMVVGGIDTPAYRLTYIIHWDSKTQKLSAGSTSRRCCLAVSKGCWFQKITIPSGVRFDVSSADTEPRHYGRSDTSWLLNLCLSLREWHGSNRHSSSKHCTVRWQRELRDIP